MSAAEFGGLGLLIIQIEIPLVKEPTTEQIASVMGQFETLFAKVPDSRVVMDTYFPEADVAS